MQIINSGHPISLTLFFFGGWGAEMLTVTDNFQQSPVLEPK